MQIKMNGEEVKNVDHFKYMGSVIDTDGTIDRDVWTGQWDIRVQAAWSSWRELTGVLYCTTGRFPQAQTESLCFAGSSITGRRNPISH